MSRPAPTRPVTCYVCPRCDGVCRRADGRPFSEGYEATRLCPGTGRRYEVRVERGAARTRAV